MDNEQNLNTAKDYDGYLFDNSETKAIRHVLIARGIYLRLYDDGTKEILCHKNGDVW